MGCSGGRASAASPLTSLSAFAKTTPIVAIDADDIGGVVRGSTLLIDASLDEDLLRPFWPTVEVTGMIEVDTPHQRITQIAHPFSKDTATPL